MNILLVEPKAETLYIPLGLMKLAAYHGRIKKDYVRYVRGFDEWEKVSKIKWDRIYITTLFTFTYDTIIKTVNKYLTLIPTENLYIGGIVASLLPKEIKKDTGAVNVIQGRLFNSAKIDFDDNINIDILTPSYGIFEGKYKHKLPKCYFIATTIGCPNQCHFCMVHKICPIFKTTNYLKRIIHEINLHYGKKKNLLLFDNNILCSEQFPQIIEDIKACGYTSKKRGVIDITQGLDITLVNRKNLQLLATIPLVFYRFSCDTIEKLDIYLKAIELASHYGAKIMYNFFLYNSDHDTPEDFFNRLIANVELQKKLGAKTVITLALMRFFPYQIKSKEFIGKYWNKKYLNAIPKILKKEEVRCSIRCHPKFVYPKFGRTYEEFIEKLEEA